MPRLNDLTGKRFGRLLVIKRISAIGVKHIKWECTCDCGGKSSPSSTHLLDGSASSCGCYQKECASKNHKKHGARRTAEYQVWCGMIQRCTNKRSKSYSDYGGRGITVSKEWLDFGVFLSDMGPRPTPAHQIDRIDNNGNYNKENCRWAVRKVQANNKRNNGLITYKGETKTYAQWAHELNMHPSLLYARLNLLGWTIDRAFIMPVRRLKRA